MRLLSACARNMSVPHETKENVITYLLAIYCDDIIYEICPIEER
jgi:hypothetical protein